MYYVTTMGRKPYHYQNGHSLKSALAFARIGSQSGSGRVVTRGRSGKIVRVYLKGKRAYPVSKRELRGFSRSEIPTELR